MDQPWQFQLRVYLDEAQAERARHREVVEPLQTVLRNHAATMVSQLDAFEAYVAEAEAEGVEAFALYQWTKATVQDPAMRAKHGTSFAIRIRDAEVYDAAAADALEADLRPLVNAGVVQRLSRHDTNPANNIPIPKEYRG